MSISSRVRREDGEPDDLEMQEKLDRWALLQYNQSIICRAQFSRPCLEHALPPIYAMQRFAVQSKRSQKTVL